MQSFPPSLPGSAVMRFRVSTMIILTTQPPYCKSPAKRRWRVPGSEKALGLRVISAQKKHAVVIDDSEAHAVKPTRAAQKALTKRKVMGEENDNRKLDAKSTKRDLVLVGHKRACHSPETLRPPRFDIQLERLSVPALKNAVRGACVDSR